MVRRMREKNEVSLDNPTTNRPHGSPPDNGGNDSSDLRDTAHAHIYGMWEGRGVESTLYQRCKRQYLG